MYSDFLNDVLSSNTDIRVTLELPPQEAMQGTIRVIRLSGNEPCSLCRGQGRVPGVFLSKQCHYCEGRGIVPCQKLFHLTIPPHIRDGQVLTLSGHGLYTLFAQSRGDLYVQISIKASVPVLQQPPQPAPSFAQGASPFAPTLADVPAPPLSFARQHTPTAAKEADVLSGVPSRFGNYAIVRPLGEGGFAHVYLAEHEYLHTQAAIKVLKERMDQQEVQQFLREAQTIASLRHPHIVQVLDCGVQDTYPYIVMGYAPGGSLENRYPAGSRLSLGNLLPYVRQVASALQHAHDQNIIHRDVKPANMLLDGEGSVLLSDFGIAVAAHRTRSMRVEQAVGSTSYMAPEQIQGKPRPASDQYSLAVVAYEWLCGVCPFEGDTPLAIAMQQLNTPPPPLRSKIATISPVVERIILKALSKDPHQRFASVEAFATALAQA